MDVALEQAQWMAQERPGWRPVMSRDSLNGDERWPYDCWKDLRESETAVLLNAFTLSLSKYLLNDYCLIGTLLSLELQQKTEIFPHGAYILARDTDNQAMLQIIIYVSAMQWVVGACQGLCLHLSESFLLQPFIP